MLSTGDHHHLAALLDAVVGQPQLAVFADCILHVNRCSGVKAELDVLRESLQTNLAKRTWGSCTMLDMVRKLTAKIYLL
jgi:hypothetical protein